MSDATYKAAGVDIEAGYRAVDLIKRHAKTTYRPEVLGDIGGFGGFFGLDTTAYKAPVLVSGTDGVGTKLKFAFLLNKHDTIGIDCVAYCVNDIICQGAEPLFFLDYLAVGQMIPEQVEQIVSGIAHGCREAKCALIGGETAEMPGFYKPGEYDLAGFVVGVVDREKVLDGSAVKPGDVILGIHSTGLQSSGFSLVRKAVLEMAKLNMDSYVDELQAPLGEALLTPTGIYAQAVQALLAHVPVHGIANISGGGLEENIPRSLSHGTTAVVDPSRWEVPPIFKIVRKAGNIAIEEMFRTFNMGIGMVAILPETAVDEAARLLKEYGWQSDVIGMVEKGDGRGFRFA